MNTGELFPGLYEAEYRVLVMQQKRTPMGDGRSWPLFSMMCSTSSMTRLSLLLHGVGFGATRVDEPPESTG